MVSLTSSSKINVDETDETGDNVKENLLDNLLKNLKEQFDQKLYCDIELVAGDGTKISAHKNILAASSRYFSAMFSSGMKENEMKEIPLQDVDGEALRLLLAHCYSGEINITTDNVETILPAASRYEFADIERKCGKCLEKFLCDNPANCMQYYSLASLYNFGKLKDLSMTFMCENFMTIKDTDDFLFLELEFLMDLVKNDELIADCEENVYEVIMKWINYNKAERQQYLIPFLRCIRFTDMQITYLLQNVMEVFESVGLRNVFTEILEYKFDPNIKTTLLAEYSFQQRKRIPSGSLLAFITEENSDHLYIENFDDTHKKWNLLPPVTLPFDGPIKSVAFWRKFYFIYGKNGNVGCVDKKTLQTNLLPNMRTIRENGAMIIHNDYIYVMGGWRLNYQFSTNDVERYDIIKNSWTICGRMRNKKPYPIAVVVRDLIYCAGTVQVGFPIECINPESGLWTILPMTNSRNNVSHMINHNNELYVLGDGLIEKFDLSQKRWTSIYDSTNIVIPKYIYSNQLVRIDFEPDGKQKEKYFISKFCVERKNWIHYGRLGGRYNTLFNKNSFKFLIFSLNE